MLWLYLLNCNNRNYVRLFIPQRINQVRFGPGFKSRFMHFAYTGNILRFFVSKVKHLRSIPLFFEIINHFRWSDTPLNCDNQRAVTIVLCKSTGNATFRLSAANRRAENGKPHIHPRQSARVSAGYPGKRPVHTGSGSQKHSRPGG